VCLAWCICVSVVAAACGHAGAPSAGANATSVTSGATAPRVLTGATAAAPTTASARRATPGSKAATVASEPPPLRFRRAVTAAAPLRVGYIGDSVAFSVLLSLRAAGFEISVHDHLPLEFAGGFNGPGFGLTADVEGHNDIGPTPPPSSFANWRDSVRKMVTDNDPDVVLVLLGVWDTIDRSPSGRALPEGTPAWTMWYQDLADQFVRSLVARGGDVIWVLMPCVGRPQLNQRLHAVNSVLQNTWRVAPGEVGYVSLARVACQGETPVYTTAGPHGSVSLREPDGIHFVPADAQTVLQPFFARQLAALFHPLLRS
jgi:hypothetical protein